MQRELKVLVVAVSWPPETFIIRTLHAVARAGTHVILGVSTARRNRTPEDSLLEILELPSWSHSWPKRMVTLLRLLARAIFVDPRFAARVAFGSERKQDTTGSRARERVIRLYRLLPFAGVHADLLHFQWNASAIEYASLFDLLSLPVVISCRGAQISIAPHNPRRSKIVQGLKETLSRASAVHCVSEAIAAEAASFGADPRKTFVIRPAVDPDFFRPLQRALSSENNALRVIATGALIWRKGFEYAITAVRRALDEGVRVNLEIIGDGPDRQRLLYTIHDLGVENEVRLVGRLDPEAVRNELQQSDVYLLSSLSEGIANAALEAMACGLPVVSTACGGMAEVISDGVEGFVVPVRDSAAMADALVRLGRDPQLRRRMGGTARIRILRDHNLTYQAQAFVDLYAKTVN